MNYGKIMYKIINQQQKENSLNMSMSMPFKKKDTLSFRFFTLATFNLKPLLLSVLYTFNTIYIFRNNVNNFSVFLVFNVTDFQVRKLLLYTKTSNNVPIVLS